MNPQQGMYATLASFGPLQSVAEKIESFRDLQAGWDYGRGVPISENTIQRALAWNLILKLLRLPATDASPGSDGEVSIAVGCGDHYFEVIVEADDTISVAYDFQRKQVFYRLRKTPYEALKLIIEIAGKTSSTQRTIRQMNKSLNRFV